MTSGKIDMCMASDKYECMIVYSEPTNPNVVNTWVLPKESLEMNYRSMIKRGCIIHNVFKRMTDKELLDAILR